MFNSDSICGKEIKTRLVVRERLSTTTTIWRSRAISDTLKARLIRLLIWPTLTYGTEAWTLNKQFTGNIEAFEMQCYGKVLSISYMEHTSNNEVLDRMVVRKTCVTGKYQMPKTYQDNSLEEDLMLGPMPGL